MRKLKARAVATTIAGACATLGLTLAAAPAAHAALSPSVDYPSCVGSVPRSATDDGAEVELWYYSTGSHTCIGTVEETESDDTGVGLLQRVTIYSPSHVSLRPASYVGGSGAGTSHLTFVTHVNELFPYSSVQVCSVIVYASTHTPDPNVPGICTTV